MALIFLKNNPRETAQRWEVDEIGKKVKKKKKKKEIIK